MECCSVMKKKEEERMLEILRFRVNMHFRKERVTRVDGSGK